MLLPPSESNVIVTYSLLSTCPVSAATHQGFDELLDETARQLEKLPPVLHYQEEEIPEEKADYDSFEIHVEEGVFVVSGPGMERLIDSVNFDDQESLNWFHRTLRRLGVIESLRESGAGEGSTVRIGEMDFDYIELILSDGNRMEIARLLGVGIEQLILILRSAQLVIIDLVVLVHVAELLAFDGFVVGGIEEAVLVP